MVFVTGGAGRGKTALIQAFSRRALAARPNLLVASGAGQTYSGLGDPYRPFLDILALLTGDVEAQHTAGTTDWDEAGRLWQKQERRDEARQVLAEIYGWFTEGFDTPDLKEARALLEALA